MNGFGSAGAGNHTGRRTASPVGVGQTARERVRRIIIAECHTREGTPTPSELMEYVHIGKCWWCGREATRDGKPFRSLSAHFQRGHGLNLQEIRDILMVPKSFTFISEELSEEQSIRSKKNYDPSKLINKAGRRYRLSAYGAAMNRIRACHLPAPSPN